MESSRHISRLHRRLGHGHPEGYDQPSDNLPSAISHPQGQREAKTKPPSIASTQLKWSPPAVTPAQTAAAEHAAARCRATRAPACAKVQLELTVPPPALHVWPHSVQRGVSFFGMQRHFGQAHAQGLAPRPETSGAASSLRAAAPYAMGATGDSSYRPAHLGLGCELSVSSPPLPVQSPPPLQLYVQSSASSHIMSPHANDWYAPSMRMSVPLLPGQGSLQLYAPANNHTLNPDHESESPPPAPTSSCGGSLHYLSPPQPRPAAASESRQSMHSTGSGSSGADVAAAVDSAAATANEQMHMQLLASAAHVWRKSTTQRLHQAARKLADERWKQALSGALVPLNDPGIRSPATNSAKAMQLKHDSASVGMSRSSRVRVQYDRKHGVLSACPQWEQVCALVSTAFQSTLADRPRPRRGDTAELLALYDSQRSYAYFGIEMCVVDIWVDSENNICEMVDPESGKLVRLASPVQALLTTARANQQSQCSEGVANEAHPPSPHVGRPTVRQCRVAFTPSRDVLVWVHKAQRSKQTLGTPPAAAEHSISAHGHTHDDTAEFDQDRCASESEWGSDLPPPSQAGGPQSQRKRHSHKRPREALEDSAPQPKPEQYFATASGAAAYVDQLVRPLQPTPRFRVVNFRRQAPAGEDATVGNREIQYVPVPKHLHGVLLNAAAIQHALGTL